MIKKRNRGSGASLPVGASGGASTRASKKIGVVASSSGLNTRKNSVVTITNTTPVTQVTTPTSTHGRNMNESQSPPSVSGSVGNGGSTAGSTPTSYHGSAGSSVGPTGISGGKGVVPIAAAPPKDTPGPGAAAATLSRSSTTSKRQRRHSKSISAIESMDIDSPTNSTGSNEAARSVGMGMMAVGGSMTNMGLVNGFSMSRPAGQGGALLPPGMNGMVAPPPGMVLAQNGVNGTGNGPQEWEWLTMSL